MTRRRVILTVRACIALVALTSVMVGPPWLFLLCVVLLALRFSAWEAIMLGLFADLLWLAEPISLSVFPFTTVIALVIVWGLAPVRRELLDQGPTISRIGWV